MAGPKKKLATESGDSSPPAPEMLAWMAKNALRPSLNGALTINRVAGFTNPGMDMALVNELSEQAAAVLGGDLSRAEAMLTVQAHTLDLLFNSYVQRADKAEYLKQCEGFMRLALKAQAQCRSTVEALSAMKNPRVQYVNQQNVAVNQQVNNGTVSRETTEAQKGELLEVKPQEQLVVPIAGEPASAMPVLVTPSQQNR